MVARSTDLRSQAFAARVAKQSRIAALARKNPKLFCQFVLKDEQTGNPITLSPTHKSWHDLITAKERLVIWSHVEAGKTVEVSIGRVLWEIGNNPSIRCAILSNTHAQSVKIVRSIQKYIESSPELKLVFPDLRPSDPWSAQQLTVFRPTYSKDPTVQAFGVTGAVTGSRLDLVVIDDILDPENTRTPTARQALWEWLQATLMGRLTKDAKLIVVGTAYHPEDALHRYAKLWGPGAAYRYPVVDDLTGAPRWPEHWPLSRIEAKRAETLPDEFARQMLCIARDDTHAIFKKEWIDVALRRGAGRKMAYGLKAVPNGCKTVTGVDLAVQQHSSADMTVLFTILLHPDQTRELLWIDAGRWQGPEIVQRIIDTHERYHSMVWVENNASQEFILQFARARSAVPLRPFTTGRNKAHPEFGVQSLATEMANGKWIIPNDNRGYVVPEVDNFIQEMLFYDPKSHTGDRLMAAWFAREGARQANVRAEVGTLDLMTR